MAGEHLARQSPTSRQVLARRSAPAVGDVRPVDQAGRPSGLVLDRDEAQVRVTVEHPAEHEGDDARSIVAVRSTRASTNLSPAPRPSGARPAKACDPSGMPQSLAKAETGSHTGSAKSRPSPSRGSRTWDSPSCRRRSRSATVWPDHRGRPRPRPSDDRGRRHELGEPTGCSPGPTPQPTPDRRDRRGSWPPSGTRRRRRCRRVHVLQAVRHPVGTGQERFPPADRPVGAGLRQCRVLAGEPAHHGVREERRPFEASQSEPSRSTSWGRGPGRPGRRGPPICPEARSHGCRRRSRRNRSRH